VEKVIQRLTKEIQELKTEIQGLKNKENRSGYENYYLNKQESQLRDRQAKLEKLREINSSNSSNSSNDFPVG
jgi:regulator of replication initiation timing